MSDLTMMRDRTQLFALVVTSNNVALDLTGKTLTFTVREYFSATTARIAKSSPASGITITSPASAGLATLQVDPADTGAISNTGSVELYYDLMLTDGTNKYNLASGKFYVTGNVTT
jgi:hypothetical protein